MRISRLLTGRRLLRPHALASILLAMTCLSACGFSATFSSTSDQAGAAASTSLLQSNRASAPASPSPASPAPTATDTAVPDTPTPDATATATAEIAQQWRSNVQQVANIDAELAQAGKGFQSGALSLQNGAAKLHNLDGQAATVNQSVQSLPPPPGVDAATLAHYRQSVNTWSAAIHNLDVAVGNNDIFSAPSLANRLQSIASDLENQNARLSSKLGNGT